MTQCNNGIGQSETGRRQVHDRPCQSDGMLTPRKPGKPLVSLREIKERIADLRREAEQSSPGVERDTLQAEIGALVRLYEAKRAIEPPQPE